MVTIDLKALAELTERTDKLLWESFSCSEDRSFSQLSDNLIFPRYEDPHRSLRVSEQEARFAFTKALEGSPFLYSVETPTQRKYLQTGSRETRASFDLSLYNLEGLPQLNIEFKAGGISTKAKSSLKIRKDLEKLLKDPGYGMWFHLFESVDTHTISKLFQTICRDMSELLCNLGRQVEAKLLIFHVCTLRHRFSLHKVLGIKGENTPLSEVQEFFQIKYDVTRSRLLKILEGNGWNCLHQPVRE